MDINSFLGVGMVMASRERRFENVAMLERVDRDYRVRCGIEQNGDVQVGCYRC
jgi:hypothetical protein